MVAVAAALVLGGVTTGASGQVVGTPDIVGQWTEPFEEGGAGTPRCVPAENDTPGFLVCKPAAQASAMLPDGRILYWNGIESQENAGGPSVPSLSPSARDSQARVLDLRSGTPQWVVPTPERGDHQNPDIKEGQDNGPAGNLTSPQGRPGDGFTGTLAGKLGLPESAPDSPPDDASANDGDMFCADVTTLPDGRVLIAGGTDWYNEPRFMDRNAGDPADLGVVELEGLRSSATFDYKTNTFSATQPMKYGRWYPGMVVLEDGKVLVTSGASQMTNKQQASQVRRNELFDPATNAWTEQFTGDTSETSLPMQPRQFLTPSGKVFYTGVGQMWGPFGQAADEAIMMFQQLWDPASKTWSITGMGPLGARSGTQVVAELMEPPYDQLNLVTFGGTLGPPPGNWIPANAFTTVTSIDANDNVTNKMVGELNHARWFPSGVLLPDGKILTVGGGDKDEVIDPGVEIPVKVAEVYDPATASWTEVAEHTRDRTYHNSAILLPDMRVLLGGHAPIASHYGGANADQGGPFANNDNDPSFEVWSPPYLFRGARPSITRAQAGVSYGENFTIGTPNADDIESVVLLKTPSAQHVNDSDGRGLKLEFSRTDSNALTAVAPPNGKVAPPGDYYLIINKKTLQGPVPSVARIVKVGVGTDLSDAIQPYADDNPAAPTGGSATPDEDSSRSTAAVRQANEAAKGAPAPVAEPATAATETATQAYTQLSATPASSPALPFSSPVLPLAAIGAAAGASWTGRRWFRR
ncbi:MAG: galactose oxidase-like domain-containing protein [Acidimicrobiia bacterium]